MDPRFFPVKRSVLEETALVEQILSNYGLERPVQCRFMRQSMSDVYLVNTPGRQYYLKVYMAGRHAKTNILAEIQLLLDLLEQQLPVVRPIQNNDGIYLNEINAPEGIRCGVLFEAITGKPPQETNPEDSRRFGRLAARLHACADRLNTSYDRWHLDEHYLIEMPLNTMKPYLRHRPQDFDFLKRLGNELIAELHALLPKTQPEYGVCHRDLHTGNALYDQEGRLTLMDFDSFGYGWRALDVGVYLESYDWMDLSAACKIKKGEIWATFLDGYNRERSLSDNELAAAALSPAFRHFELMGVTMRYWTQAIGSDWINDDYFDKHLAWFKMWARQYRDR